jgi:predicted Na+-dependent transporter
MNITTINAIFRALALIPLIYVFYGLLVSCWEKRNTINGLKKTRRSLLILIFALIFSNAYFFFFSILKLSRTDPANQLVVVADKIINLVAYWLLYWLFKSHKTDKPINNMIKENHKTFMQVE